MIYLDEHLDEHPKFVHLSAHAFTTWLRLLMYCRRNQTDGFIPVEAAVRRVPQGRKAVDVLSELARPSPACPSRSPLLILSGGAYELHDYLEWNPSREQISAKRAAKVENGRRAGKASAQRRSNQLVEPIPTPNPQSPIPYPRSTIPEEERTLSGSKETKSKDPWGLVPTGQDPDAPVAKKQAAPKKTPRTGCPLLTDPAIQNWLAQHEIPPLADADVGAEVARFVDFHSSKGTLAASWSASWRTWCGNWTDNGGSIQRKHGPHASAVPVRRAPPPPPPLDLEEFTKRQKERMRRAAAGEPLFDEPEGSDDEETGS